MPGNASEGLTLVQACPLPSFSLLQGSNESSDDEDGPSHQSPYSDGDTDPGITDPGVTEAGMSDITYPDEHPAHCHANDPMGSMGSTAFWDPPDLQHPANSSKVSFNCLVSGSCIS